MLVRECQAELAVIDRTGHGLDNGHVTPLPVEAFRGRAERRGDHALRLEAADLPAERPVGTASSMTAPTAAAFRSPLIAPALP